MWINLLHVELKFGSEDKTNSSAAMLIESLQIVGDGLWNGFGEYVEMGRALDAGVEKTVDVDGEIVMCVVGLCLEWRF